MTQLSLMVAPTTRQYMFVKKAVLGSHLQLASLFALETADFGPALLCLAVV
jgi:hypothetical protein